MDNKKIHMTFDLETLGDTSTSPIVQIGGVKFEDNGNILDRFIVNIDLESYPENNYVIKPTYSTILWWLMQEKEAQESVFFSENRKDILEAIRLFEEWSITEPGIFDVEAIWSHNSFDPNILKSNYKALNLDFPFPFRKFLDIRTLLYFSPKQDVEHVGVKHNALHDAIHQARFISKSLMKINRAITYV